MDLIFTLRCHISVSLRSTRTIPENPSWVHPADEPLSFIRKWRTAGEPLLAHASLHSFTSASIPPSPLVSRALARGSARCLRLASVFASRVRAHGNPGLTGVCARVGRPAARDVIRLVRVIRVRVLTRSRAKRSLIKFITRPRPIIATALSPSATRGRKTRENHCRDAAGLFAKNRADRDCANAMTYVPGSGGMRKQETFHGDYFLNYSR